MENMKKNLSLFVLSFGIFFVSFAAFGISMIPTNQKKEITQNPLELIFILDRSGSMGGLESDTIGGYNSMLEKQKKENGEVFVTTVLFDSEYELLHNRVSISSIQPITEKEYYVRGSTALLDAIGKTIQNIKAGNVNNKNRVLFIITTDGRENASVEYTTEQIKKLIETQKKEYDWEFLFLGANIDAIQTAKNFGIDASKAVQYHSDSIGTQKNFETLNDAVSEVRKGNKLNAEWKKEIEEDFEKRK